MTCVYQNIIHRDLPLTWFISYLFACVDGVCLMPEQVHSLQTQAPLSSLWRGYLRAVLRPRAAAKRRTSWGRVREGQGDLKKSFRKGQESKGQERKGQEGSKKAERKGVGSASSCIQR